MAALTEKNEMSKKLFVGSLSWDTNDEGLRNAFAVHGEISEAVVVSDRDTGRSRGFGFVTFEDDESADKAIAALETSVKENPEDPETYERLGRAYDRKSGSGPAESPVWSDRALEAYRTSSRLRGLSDTPPEKSDGEIIR